MAINLKAATPDTTIPSGAFLFGADSQSAAAPSVYPVANIVSEAMLSPLNAALDIKGGPTGIGITGSSTAMVAGRLYMTRLKVGAAVTVEELGIRVGTASGAGTFARLGIYSAHTNGLPGTLLASGTVATDAVAYAVDTGVSVALSPELEYWLAALFESTPSVLAFNNGSAGGAAVGYSYSGAASQALGGIYRAMTYGALNSDESASSWTFAAVAIPVVFWDV